MSYASQGRKNYFPLYPNPLDWDNPASYMHNDDADEVVRWLWVGECLYPTWTSASAKYLDMTWNECIEKIASKANKKLGFLPRNIMTRDQSLKERAYTTIVRPTVDYCSTVSDPYNNTYSNTLEKVQICRWVTGRFHNMCSPNVMIQDLGWRDLNQCRAESNVCCIKSYKVL